jgi:carbonic anhydrase/acetyltransferase-like protein (isoleucine patch superfamily)
LFGRKFKQKDNPKYIMVSAGEVENPVKGEKAQKMYRIRALRDIPEHGVKKGDWGGYVQEAESLSHKGGCWVADQAQVIYNVRITGDVLVADHAIVDGEPGYMITLCDDVQILGNAQVLARTGHASSNDIRELSCFNENFVAKDLAYIRNLALGTGDAVVGGHADIRGAREISGTSVVLDRAVIRRGAVVEGNSTVGGDAVIEENEIVSSLAIGINSDDGNQRLMKIVAPRKSKMEELENTSTPSAVVPTAVTVFNEVMSSIAAYQEDIVKIIKYPVMTDRTDAHTRTMAKAMNQAQRLFSLPDTKEFQEAVESLEDAFLAAESNAIKVASTVLTEVERKKVERAKDMLEVASNEASTEHEKKVAFVQGFKHLEGVLTVPEKAVDAFRIKVGLKELES